MHRYQAALAKFRKAVTVTPWAADPWNEWARRSLGRALYETQRPDLGQQYFADQRQRYPNSVGTIQEEGDVLRQFGRYAEAVEKYKAILSIDAYQTGAYSGWGQ